MLSRHNHTVTTIMTARFDIHNGAPRILWRLLFLAVAFAVVCRAKAQNNQFKINDELYVMYSELNKIRYRKEALPQARRMYERAAQLGDRKAQCLALIIPPQYYYYKKVEDDMFEQSLKRLQDVARQYGYWQYFYYGATLKVQYLINVKRDEAEAFRYTNGMIDYATRNKHPYGIFNGFNNMGMIHLSRSEFGLAAHNYRQALEVGLEHLPDQDMATQYRKIADCYEQLYRYGDMLKYAMDGLSIVKNKAVELRLLMHVCVAEYMMGRYDKFKEYYERYNDMVHGINPNTKNFYEVRLLLLNALCEYDWKAVETYYDKIDADGGFVRDKMILGIEYCRREGNYMQMANNQKLFYQGRIRLQDSVRRENYSAINARLTNLRIDMENQRLAVEHQLLVNERNKADIANANLQLANTRLSLENSSLELSRTKSRSQLMHLSYERKRMEAQRLKSRVTAARARNAVEKTFMASCSVVLIVVLCAVAAYMFKRNRVARHLHKTNIQLERRAVQLAEALERAQVADRAKSQFITNMDEDIRRPLNDIVAAARSIAAQGKTATPQKLAELNRRLHDSTDKVLDIVAEVLHKAEG